MSSPAIDPKTGEKTINPAAIPHIGQTTVNCPADPGGRGWPATAYNPKTGILYMPLNEYCSNTTPTPLDPGQSYTGGGRAIFARDGAQQRRQCRPRRCHQADRPVDRLVVPRSVRRRPARCCRPAAASFSQARGTATSVRSTMPPARCCGRRASTTRSTRFPISYSVNGKQYVAVAVGNGSSQAKALATLTPEISLRTAVRCCGCLRSARQENCV